MHSNTASQPVSPRSTLARFVAPAAAVILLTGCMMFSRAPQDLDYSRTRVSEAGTYRGTIRPQGDSIPQGRLQSWTLHLETASGAPVDSASIVVDGGMPQHGHGLPTKPVVTRQSGNGDHVVEGLKFNMGGWWVVKFRVSSCAGTDSLVFNIKL
jgi:YtkA-like